MGWQGLSSAGALKLRGRGGVHRQHLLPPDKVQGPGPLLYISIQLLISSSSSSVCPEINKTSYTIQ
eukprot:scaffold360980_cov31-Prasinocladus_malaysianus.AAC.1